MATSLFRPPGPIIRKPLVDSPTFKESLAEALVALPTDNDRRILYDFLTNYDKLSMEDAKAMNEIHKNSVEYCSSFVEKDSTVTVEKLEQIDERAVKYHHEWMQESEAIVAELESTLAKEPTTEGKLLRSLENREMLKAARHKFIYKGRILFHNFISLNEEDRVKLNQASADYELLLDATEAEYYRKLDGLVVGSFVGSNITAITELRHGIQVEFNDDGEQKVILIKF